MNSYSLLLRRCGQAMLRDRMSGFIRIRWSDDTYEFLGPGGKWVGRNDLRAYVETYDEYH